MKLQDSNRSRDYFEVDHHEPVQMSNCYIGGGIKREKKKKKNTRVYMYSSKYIESKKGNFVVSYHFCTKLRFKVKKCRP